MLTHDAGQRRRRAFEELAMSDVAAAWLRLSLARGIPGEAARNAANHPAGLAALIHAGHRALTALGIPHDAARSLTGPPPDWLPAALDWLAEPGHDLLTLADADYPALLRQMPDAPVALFLRGDRALLGMPHFAIVGSRNPTPQGAENAFAFAEHLARCGLAICSGLAAGIDSAAHRGALAADGATTAVLGCGPDRVYPPANVELARRISTHGLLISEYLPGTAPIRENFPRRNRIISGLSTGVLVVEAARRSGSLITARLAGEQGREVFAIPGSIHNPLARGCHELIRQGAVLVETAGDILAEIGPLTGVSAAPEAPAAGALAVTPQPDGDYRKLLAALAHDPAGVDGLAARTGLTAAEVSSMMLILELQGAVESLPGGRFARKTTRS
jgi:DNA processing protein